ncbi:CPBP family intramembrane glutamic endopeptidase [Undibacterium sp. TJN25]|uniref:CPBP family intramembrane glutamic endopeptidase n=1 Tax=Undibacterium sp. TJN25 TaxID=3413056 RepID=UPI003BF39CB2
MKQTNTISATPLEALSIVAICFGWFIFNSLLSLGSESAKGEFSDASFLSLIVVELALGSFALLVLRLRGHSLRALLPVPTWYGGILGVLAYAAATWISSLVTALFDTGMPEQPIEQMMSHATPSLTYVFALALVNGLYEEVFLLGYLQRSFSAAAPSFAIGLAVLVRLLYHLYQGPLGALSIVAYGLVIGIFYWRTNMLWPAVFAHMLADILPFALR